MSDILKESLIMLAVEKYVKLRLGPSLYIFAIQFCFTWGVLIVKNLSIRAHFIVAILPTWPMKV